MPDLLEQRKLDVEEQFLTLPNELKEWRDVSKEGGDYEKHHSQIAVLSKQMLDLNRRIESEWRKGPEPDSFESLARARQRCAAIQTVWGFFREKLIFRSNPIYGRFLKVADAYAWACYQPVLKDAQARNPGHPYREPPLVAFHNEISPWALSRQSRYETEQDSAGMAGTSEDSPYEQVRRALPIPILATPWHTVQFLPNVALLAHETGHVVETGFGLERKVAVAIAAAIKDPVHREGWSEYWRKEVFADLFGCFAAGPAFVWALVDSILESPAVVATKSRPATMLDPDPAKRWGKYPPAALRVALNVCALREHGYTGDADRIDAYWKAAYPADAMAAWVDDVAPVVQAVFAVGLPDKLKSRALEADLQWAYNSTGAGGRLDNGRRMDPRALVWAACVMHRGGDAMLGPPILVKPAIAWKLLQDHIVDSRPPGVLAEQLARADVFETRTDELVALLFAEFDD